ncbi:MAG TPA: L,D-transpeptidase [Terriglobales bacterium]|nr:L,D-transpeptidase [Terriglobales bacterium]
MRRIDGNSELKAKARLVLAILVLAAARARAQETAQPETVRQIVVSLPDRKLALIEDGQVSRIYDVAIGRPSSPSPIGTFKIVNRVTNPTYYHKGQIVEPGPQNPVGTRWIGLNQKGYGIHGTNAPRSIGKAVSHGCIRMAKKDLEDLFEIVRPGDVVEIHGESDDLTAQIFGSSEPMVVATANTLTDNTVDGRSMSQATR